MERIDKFKSISEWPFNFIYLLHDHNPIIPGKDDIWPENFVATLEYLLMTKVKAEHRIEIILYYRDGKSLAEIGKERGYSSQAVALHIRRVIRTLCGIYNARILRLGLAGYYAEQVKKADDRGYARGLVDGRIKTLKESGAILSDDTPIEDLGLSVRAFNCLKRAGYDTVGMVTSASRDDISKIRNLGNKCIHEIYDRLNGHGPEMNWSPEEI